MGSFQPLAIKLSFTGRGTVLFRPRERPREGIPVNGPVNDPVGGLLSHSWAEYTSLLLISFLVCERKCVRPGVKRGFDLCPERFRMRSVPMVGSIPPPGAEQQGADVVQWKAAALRGGAGMGAAAHNVSCEGGCDVSCGFKSMPTMITHQSFCARRIKSMDSQFAGEVRGCIVMSWTSHSSHRRFRRTLQPIALPDTSARTPAERRRNPCCAQSGEWPMKGGT
eukprot:gene13730-biopygen4436